MSEAKRPRGRPPKLGEYQAFTLRLPPELHEELLETAHARGISLNDLLLEISKEWLKKDKGLD